MPSEPSYLLIVASGGYATRALTLTGCGAKMKALVNAGPDGATVLETILREAKQSRIEHTAVVVSSEKDAQTVRRFLDPLGEDPAFRRYLIQSGKTEQLEQIRALPRFRQAECLVQTEPRGFGDAAALAADMFFEGGFAGACVALGDDLVHAPAPAMAQLISAHKSLGGTVAAVQRVSKKDASRYGAVLIQGGPLQMPPDFIGKAAYRAVNMEEKPANPTPNRIDGEETYLAVAGRYVIDADDMRFLSRSKGAVGNELDFTAMLRQNAAAGTLAAVELDGVWHTVGDPLEAQKAYLRYALLPQDGNASENQRELQKYAKRLLKELPPDESG